MTRDELIRHTQPLIFLMINEASRLYKSYGIEIKINARRDVMTSIIPLIPKLITTKLVKSSPLKALCELLNLAGFLTALIRHELQRKTAQLPGIHHKTMIISKDAAWVKLKARTFAHYVGMFISDERGAIEDV